MPGRVKKSDVPRSALPTPGCASDPPELEVSLSPLVWQTRSLQAHSVCRQPLVAGGHHQHQALHLRVVHRGGVEPSLLGSDEPLHGSQRSGHNEKIIPGAKGQIRICVLRVPHYAEVDGDGVLTMWPPHRDRRGFGMMEWRTRLKVTTETGQGAAVRSEARVATLLAPERRPGAA